MREGSWSLRLLLMVLVMSALAGCSDNDPATTGNICPPGTVRWDVNGHCYEAVLAPGVSWDNALIACIARGGYLATITSAEENQFVFSLVSDNSAFWFLDGFNNGLGPWLGGFQSPNSKPNENWHWVTGEPFVYTNWAPGQPGDLGGGVDQNLLRFFKPGGLIGDQWDDCEPNNPPAHRKGYIFEYGGTLPPPQTIVLNNAPLHLGNSADKPPIYGLEYAWVDNVNSTFPRAALSVQFLGKQTNWGTNNATINGVDMPSNTNPSGVQLLVNNNTWTPLYSDFPNNPSCIDYWAGDPNLPSYECPFVFTIDITYWLKQGQNQVIVRSNGDDFVIKDVTIRLY